MADIIINFFAVLVGAGVTILVSRLAFKDQLKLAEHQFEKEKEERIRKEKLDREERLRIERRDRLITAQDKIIQYYSELQAMNHLLDLTDNHAFLGTQEYSEKHLKHYLMLHNQIATMLISVTESDGPLEKIGDLMKTVDDAKLGEKEKLAAQCIGILRDEINRLSKQNY